MPPLGITGVCSPSRMRETLPVPTATEVCRANPRRPVLPNPAWPGLVGILLQCNHQPHFILLPWLTSPLASILPLDAFYHSVNNDIDRFCQSSFASKYGSHRLLESQQPGCSGPNKSYRRCQSGSPECGGARLSPRHQRGNIEVA